MLVTVLLYCWFPASPLQFLSHEHVRGNFCFFCRRAADVWNSDKKKNTYLGAAWACHPKPSPGARLSQPTLHGKHSRINPTKSTASMKNSFNSPFMACFSSWWPKCIHSQELLALWVRLCHLAMTTQAFFPENVQGFSPWSQGFLFWAPQEEVGRQNNWPCMLPVSKFSLLLFALQAGNRWLGHSDIFSLQGGQKKWMLPSGDMLLYFILEGKKKVFLFFITKLCKGIFLLVALQVASDRGYSEIHFHINPVPWLYASSRHCSLSALRLILHCTNLFEELAIWKWGEDWYYAAMNHTCDASEWKSVCYT